jgi:bacterioferritin-associated ferredoxin
MKKFKDYLSTGTHNFSMEEAAVSLRYKDHTLYLLFDSKDVLVKASYSGPSNPWLGSLCDLSREKSLPELRHLCLADWEVTFKEDPFFWELYQDINQSIFPFHLEMLHAGLDIYQGKDYLYREASPLVCRCFGVREKDISEHLHQTTAPTLQTLAESLKAGLGCRSCLSQLNRWLDSGRPQSEGRYFKQRSYADWLLLTDKAIRRMPHHEGWNLEVKKFKAHQVLITYDKEVTQREEEEFSLALQRFLAGAVDSDLGFFLIRARHFSNAEG